MMAKRFAALLLAVCLTFTCALGAWAEGADDLTSTPSTAADTLKQGGDGTDMEQTGDSGDKQVSGPANDGEGDADTVSDAQEDAPAGGAEGDGGAVGGTQDSGAPEEGAPAPAKNARDAANGSEQDGADAAPAPAAVSDDEWKEKLDQFDLIIASYIDGHPADGDNIAKSNTLTIYYLIARPHEDSYIVTCGPDEIEAELGVTELSIYSECTSSNGRLAQVYRLEKPKEIWDGCYAYFAQDVTFTEAGQFDWTCCLTAKTPEDATVQGEKHPFYEQVRDEIRTGGADTLAQRLQLQSVTRPDVDDAQQHIVPFKETFKLDLPVKGANGQQIEDVGQYIQEELGLDPGKVTVECDVIQGEKANIRMETFQKYSGSGLLGTQKFTVTSPGSYGIRYSLMYEGKLARTIRYYFEDRHHIEKETLIKAAEACGDWGAMVISNGAESAVGYTDEPMEFLISFDQLEGMNDASVAAYLYRTIRQSIGKDMFGLTTIENWYKYGDTGAKECILTTAVEGIQILYPDPDSDEFAKVGIQDVGSAKNPDPKKYYVSIVCTPTQPGKYHLDSQFTSVTGGILVGADDAQAAGMPHAGIDFIVVNRPEVTADEVTISQQDESVGVPDQDQAKKALVEAYENEVAKKPGLEKMIRGEAGDNKKITVGLTVKNAADSDESSFQEKFDGSLTYKDIDIEVKADNVSIYTIHETQTPIGFNFTMPGDGPIAVVLRSHDGEGVTFLPCRVENGKVYFESDKFSTYAIGSTNNIAYADVQPIGSQAYTGKEIKPDITVSINGRQVLKQGEDYKVSYQNNVDNGTATVVIEGMGRYRGKKEISFTIVRPAPAGGTAPAKADEYIVCKACGHQTWEPYLEGWRCTNCGYLRGTTGVPAAAAAKAAPAAYRGTIPQTADEFPLAGVAAVFCVSLAGLGALLLLRKKQK